MAATVNAKEWEVLEPDQQQAIQSIIKKHFPDQPADIKPLPLDNACTVGCNVAMAAAIAACNELPFGSGVCISIAKTAGDYCLSKC